MREGGHCMRCKGLLVLILVILLSCSGCYGRRTEEGESLLRVASLGSPLTLNPLFVRDAASAEVVSLLHPVLLGFDRETLLPQPRLFSDWQISEDGLIYTFTLRSDVQWSDGALLTAEDVAYTIRAICHPDYTGSLFMHMSRIEGAQEYRMSQGSPVADGQISGIRIVDDFCLEITLAERFAPFLTYMAISVLPYHLLRDVKVAELEGHRYSREVPVGAGPYLLSEWVPDRYIHVRANEKYFLGRPEIENLYYTIIPNQETQLIEFLAGRLDLLPTSLKVEDIEQLQSDESLVIYSHLRLAYDFLGFNMKRKDSPLANKNVRIALSMILDRKQVVENLLLGYGRVAPGPLSPLQFAFNQELSGQQYDPDLAKEILRLAGKLPELKLIYNAGNLIRENTALLFKESAASLGIDVRINILEWEAFLEAMQDGDYDLILLGYGTGIDPDLTYYWHSESPGNSLGYSNREVDLLLEEALKIVDKQRRIELYQQAEQLIVADAPVIWLYYRMAYHAATVRLKNFKPHPASLFYNVHEWRLEG